VQIVEVTEESVRAVELRLCRPDGALQFLLYPMIHIGDPEFYADVSRRLALADVIVAEGVGDTMTTFGLTSAYRMLADDEEHGEANKQVMKGWLEQWVPVSLDAAQQLRPIWSEISEKKEENKEKNQNKKKNQESGSEARKQ